MTKKLTYQGLFKSHLLADELMVAFPSWGGVTPENKTRMKSKPDGTEVYLFVPDAADEGKIQVVIDVHDPGVLSVGEQKQVHRDDVRTRFLLSQLANKTPQQIDTYVKNRVDSWKSLADARKDLREMLSVMAMAISLLVVDRE